DKRYSKDSVFGICETIRDRKGFYRCDYETPETNVIWARMQFECVGDCLKGHQANAETSDGIGVVALSSDPRSRKREYVAETNGAPIVGDQQSIRLQQEMHFGGACIVCILNNFG